MDAQFSPLQRLKAAYARFMTYPAGDELAVDFAYSLVFSTNRKGNRPLVWGMILGAASCGKSETIRPIDERLDTIELANFTAHTLISGYKPDNLPKGEVDEYSKLPMFHQKIHKLSDIAPLMNPTSEKDLSKILNDLRNIYDEKATFTFGNRKDISAIPCRMGLLWAGTPDFEVVSEKQGALGQRMIFFRMGENMSYAERERRENEAIRGNNTLESRRIRLDSELSAIFTDIKILQERIKDMDVVWPADLEQRLIDASLVVARSRSFVARSPETAREEFAGRLGRQFINLVECRTLLDNRTTVSSEDFQFGIRVARDTIPTISYRMLRHLYENDALIPPYKLCMESRVTEKTGLTYLTQWANGTLCFKRDGALQLKKRTREQIKYSGLFDNVLPPDENE